MGKKRRRKASPEKVPQKKAQHTKQASQWTARRMAIVLALLFGAVVGMAIYFNHTGSSAAPAVPTQTGGPDSYGRPPEDPHYGHDHPPEAPHTMPGQGNASEPDAYGRPPGDPHYGHDHP